MQKLRNGGPVNKHPSLVFVSSRILILAIFSFVGVPSVVLGFGEPGANQFFYLLDFPDKAVIDEETGKKSEVAVRGKSKILRVTFFSETNLKLEMQSLGI